MACTRGSIHLFLFTLGNSFGSSKCAHVKHCEHMRNVPRPQPVKFTWFFHKHIAVKIISGVCRASLAQLITSEIMTYYFFIIVVCGTDVNETSDQLSFERFLLFH